MKDIVTARQRAVFDASLDRRAFMGRLGLAVGMGAAAYTVPGAFSIPPAGATVPAARQGGTPVVSVYMDLPYTDMSGRATPYMPPREISVSANLTLGEDFGNYQFYV